MTLAQILAIVIFLGMFIAIIYGKVHRYIPALIGAALIIFVVFLAVENKPDSAWAVLNLNQLTRPTFWVHEVHLEHIEVSQGINWQTVIFIAGMMLMVEGLGAAGFFRWLCLAVAQLVQYKVIPVFISFMLLAGFLSMFIDSITVLLFMASVTIELARLMKFDPVPIIIAEIFAANVGGSATMVGDPPNVIIGTSLGYTFTDFALNTGPIAWVGMIVALGLMYLFFRKKLTSQANPHAPAHVSPASTITDFRAFLSATAIFILVVVLLISHAQTHLSVALIGVIAGALTLLTAGSEAPRLLRQIDWRTLLFFIGLFIGVGGLEETGVLKTIAAAIGWLSQGELTIAIALILWISAFASAIVDNIPFAATMVPVIREIAATQGMNLPSLAWTLALGTDLGGTATPIGASANVVGTAIAEREGYPITWGTFLKYSLPAMLAVVAVSHILLIIRYANGW
jgi:Na+/H+ antiporter NhaD/arsenite permease-like protein